MALLQGRMMELRGASLRLAGTARQAAQPLVQRRDFMQTRCDCTSTASSSGAAAESQEPYEMRSRGDLRHLLRTKMQQAGAQGSGQGRRSQRRCPAQQWGVRRRDVHELQSTSHKRGRLTTCTISCNATFSAPPVAFPEHAMPALRPPETCIGICRHPRCCAR